LGWAESTVIATVILDHAGARRPCDVGCVITSAAFAGKTAGVYGLAQQQAALKYAGATVWCWDDNRKTALGPGVEQVCFAIRR
jgi:hypothetical protein